MNIKAIPEGLVIDTPYNKGFVYELKERVPGLDRVWNSKNDPILPKAPRNCWIINPDYGPVVVRLIQQYYRETVSLPAVQNVGQKTVSHTYQVQYVGASKERDDGSFHSTGLIDAQWKLILPEDVLKNWFEGKPLDNRPGGTGSTYFAVLGLSSTTEDQNEIKQAYRRVAKQWHPDVCHEPDATEIFQNIQEAYSVLSNPQTLKMYLVGLEMAGHKQAAQVSRGYDPSKYGYRPPLRCGIIKAKGFFKLGRFIAQEILSWDDIVDEFGRTLVTSYNIYSQTVEEDWV